MFIIYNKNILVSKQIYFLKCKIAISADVLQRSFAKTISQQAGRQQVAQSSDKAVN